MGLGKIGLPLAVQFAFKGFDVIGCDINPVVVETVNKGASHIGGEQGLDDKLFQVVSEGMLRASSDTSGSVSVSDVVVVIVPLVVDDVKKIDYSSLDAATRDVAKGLKKDTLVIYETTLPVGSCRLRLAPLLEESGLEAGVDFHIVFSPERVSSGRIFADLEDIPKVVGGLTIESGKKGVDFYRKTLDCVVINVGSCDTAEAVKLFGMTYRDVNIALANQLAKFSEAWGLDSNKIISASNTNPNSHILTPGIGVGGHCAPVYPYFLIENSREKGVELSIPKLSRKVNDEMPEHAVSRLKDSLGGLNEKKVLVLGLAYRGGVKETQFAPSLTVIKRLKAEGATVYLNDPLFSDKELSFYAVPADLAVLPELDGVVLVTSHKEYELIDPKLLAGKGVKAFVDGRNMLDGGEFSARGIDYIGLGKG